MFLMNFHLRTIPRIVLAAAVCMMSGCSHYRIVPIYEHDSQVYYGVTQNGVIIPEYSIDVNGTFPRSQEEARSRLAARRDAYAPALRRRYCIPNDYMYSFQRIPLNTGLILVSPAVIPIIYIFDLYTGGDADNQRKSFSACVKRYIDIALNEPVNYEVSLKNKYEIVTILS